MGTTLFLAILLVLLFCAEFKYRIKRDGEGEAYKAMLFVVIVILGISATSIFL